MKGLTGIVLGSICAIVIACASTHQSMAPPPTAPPQSSGMQGSPHDQIDALARNRHRGSHLFAFHGASDERMQAGLEPLDREATLAIGRRPPPGLGQDHPSVENRIAEHLAKTLRQ